MSYEMERLHRKVRSLPNRFPDENYHETEAVELVDGSGLAMNYVSLPQPDMGGLDAGVYVRTNLQMEHFLEYEGVRKALTALVLNFFSDERQIISFHGQDWIDPSRTINLELLGSDEDTGNLILQVKPLLPSQIVDVLCAGDEGVKLHFPFIVDSSDIS